MICECCGNRGKIIDSVSGAWIACPKCKGAVSAAKSVKVEDIADINLSSYAYDILNIPECYRRVVYTNDSLNNQINGYAKNESYSHHAADKKYNMRDGLRQLMPMFFSA